MKIATFNCNSVRARLPIVLDWMQAEQPDVLALQETKVVDEQFPLAAFTDASWHVAFAGEKSYNGVALVTREEPESVSFGLQDDDGESRARLGHIRYGGVHIVNTYVPQGRELDSEAFAFKLDWLRRLCAYFERHLKSKRAKAVWLGDLNVAPTPADVHDPERIWPHVCFCQPVIDTFNEVLAFGFEDIVRKFNLETGIYTFWDYRVRGALDKGLGWRIDHVLATPSVARKATACRIDTAPRRLPKPSDHTFVVAEFDL